MQVRTARKYKKAAAIWAGLGATAGLCLIGGMAAGAGPGILAVTTVLTGAGLVGAASIGVAALGHKAVEKTERVDRAVRSARQARYTARQEQPQEATATPQNSPEWIAAKQRHVAHMQAFRERREAKTHEPS